MPALFWLVADPTAQRLAGEIAVRLAKPSLMVGLGLATICQDAAYADGTPIMTEVAAAARQGEASAIVSKPSLGASDMSRVFAVLAMASMAARARHGRLGGRAGHA